ncbi:MAG: hypothetical protein RL553_2064 [Planctomycetota bacterium]|jgi:hypothetical protein
MYQKAKVMISDLEYAIRAITLIDNIGNFNSEILDHLTHHGLLTQISGPASGLHSLKVEAPVSL